MSDFDRIFDAAMELRDRDDFERAKARLIESLTLDGLKNEQEWLASLQLGFLSDLLGDVGQAAYWYEKSVGHAPNSETSSLGLFHALLETSRFGEAVEEAERYCARGKLSTAYSEALREAVSTMPGDLATTVVALASRFEDPTRPTRRNPNRT